MGYDYEKDLHHGWLRRGLRRAFEDTEGFSGAEQLIIDEVCEWLVGLVDRDPINAGIFVDSLAHRTRSVVENNRQPRESAAKKVVILDDGIICGGNFLAFKDAEELPF